MSRSKSRPFADVTGRRFGRLTALHPVEERSARGGVVWHCRCDCGNEIDVAYNELAYTNRQSCGCQKKQHEAKLAGFLTHVDGTSVDYLKSQKLPTNNTTGVKGVYYIRGKYTAKIVFQRKQYYLGTYNTVEAAAEARKEADEALAEGTVKHYERWKQLAERDPEWAKANPVSISVEHFDGGRFSVLFLPKVDDAFSGGKGETANDTIS